MKPNSEIRELLAELLRALGQAKLIASDLYRSSAEACLNAEARGSLMLISQSKMAQAARVSALVGASPVLLVAEANPPPHDDWSSALMLAFALDQAATGALHGLADCRDARISTLARAIVEEERAHQTAVLGWLATAAGDSNSGARLARQMVAARDWIRAIFPRHTILARLAGSEFVSPDAAKRHDSFLASLGDRIQEALGVLGD